MNSRVVSVVGVVLALWMSAGHWLFGLGGSLTWWYLPTIGVVFAALQLWAARGLRRTVENGFRSRPVTVVCLVLSWVAAVGFGFTVPNNVDGELASILSAAIGSPVAVEMSIAICNPLAVVAFGLAVATIACSMVDARGPQPEEDEDNEDFEESRSVHRASN